MPSEVGQRSKWNYRAAMAAICLLGFLGFGGAAVLMKLVPFAEYAQVAAPLVAAVMAWVVRDLGSSS